MRLTHWHTSAVRFSSWLTCGIWAVPSYTPSPGTLPLYAHPGRSTGDLESLLIELECGRLPLKIATNNCSLACVYVAHFPQIQVGFRLDTMPGSGLALTRPGESHFYSGIVLWSPSLKMQVRQPEEEQSHKQHHLLSPWVRPFWKFPTQRSFQVVVEAWATLANAMWNRGMAQLVSAHSENYEK